MVLTVLQTGQRIQAVDGTAQFNFLACGDFQLCKLNRIQNGKVKAEETKARE